MRRWWSLALLVWLVLGSCANQTNGDGTPSTATMEGPTVSLPPPAAPAQTATTTATAAPSTTGTQPSTIAAVPSTSTTTTPECSGSSSTYTVDGCDPGRFPAAWWGVGPYTYGDDTTTLSDAFGDPEPVGCEDQEEYCGTWSLPGGASYILAIEDDGLYAEITVPPESPVRLAMHGGLVLGSATADDLLRMWGLPGVEYGGDETSTLGYNRTLGDGEVAIVFRADAEDRLESVVMVRSYVDTYFLGGGALRGRVVEPICHGTLCRVKTTNGADLFWWTNHCLDSMCTFQTTVFATRPEAECDGCQAGLILLEKTGDPLDDRYLVHYTEFVWVAPGTTLEFADQPAWFRSDRPDCPFDIDLDNLTITNPLLWQDPSC